MNVGLPRDIEWNGRMVVSVTDNEISGNLNCSGNGGTLNSGNVVAGSVSCL